LRSTLADVPLDVPGSVSPIRDAQMSGLEVLSGNVPLGQSITGFDPTATLIVSCRDVQYAHIPNAL
jgi:hypothetical protein